MLRTKGFSKWPLSTSIHLPWRSALPNSSSLPLSLCITYHIPAGPIVHEIEVLLLSSSAQFRRAISRIVAFVAAMAVHVFESEPYPGLNVKDVSRRVGAERHGQFRLDRTQRNSCCEAGVGKNARLLISGNVPACIKKFEGLNDGWEEECRARGRVVGGVSEFGCVVWVAGGAAMGGWVSDVMTGPYMNQPSGGWGSNALNLPSFHHRARQGYYL